MGLVLWILAVFAYMIVGLSVGRVLAYVCRRKFSLFYDRSISEIRCDDAPLIVTFAVLFPFALLALAVIATSTMMSRMSRTKIAEKALSPVKRYSDFLVSVANKVFFSDEEDV